MGRWIDLVDPTQEELVRVAPAELHRSALEQLLEPAEHDDEPRPSLESHGSYIFGVFLVPVVVAEEDRVFYQEIDLTLTRDTIITVTKTPEGERRSRNQRRSPHPSLRRHRRPNLLRLQSRNPLLSRPGLPQNIIPKNLPTRSSLPTMSFAHVMARSHCAGRRSWHVRPMLGRCP